jgi:hypothetical protein
MSVSTSKTEGNGGSPPEEDSEERSQRKGAAGSKLHFATKDALESSRRDLSNFHSSAPLESQMKKGWKHYPESFLCAFGIPSGEKPGKDTQKLPMKSPEHHEK